MQKTYYQNNTNSSGILLRVFLPFFLHLLLFFLLLRRSLSFLLCECESIVKDVCSNKTSGITNNLVVTIKMLSFVVFDHFRIHFFLRVLRLARGSTRAKKGKLSTYGLDTRKLCAIWCVCEREHRKTSCELIENIVYMCETDRRVAASATHKKIHIENRD